MAAVEGRELRLGEPLDDHEHGRVDEADVQVPIRREDLFDTVVVLGDEILDVVAAPTDIAKQRRERSGTEASARQVVDLWEHRSWNDSALAGRADQLGARAVVSIVRIDVGQDRTGVQDECHRP